MSRRIQPRYPATQRPFTHCPRAAQVLVTPRSVKSLEALQSTQQLKTIVFRLGCSYRQRLEGLLAQAGIRPRWIHLSNSVASLTRPDMHFNLARPGIALYGITPAHRASIGV